MSGRLAHQAPRVGFHRCQLNLNEVLKKRSGKEAICPRLCRQMMSFKGNGWKDKTYQTCHGYDAWTGAFKWMLGETLTPKP